MTAVGRPLIALFAISMVVAITSCSGSGPASTPGALANDGAASLATNPLVLRLPGGHAVLATNVVNRRSGSWASADAKTRQSVYVADPVQNGYYGAVCYYGPKGGDELGCLAGGPSAPSGINFPEGTWVDENNDLFVANGGSSDGYSGEVTEYALPLTASSTPRNKLYSNVTNPSEGAFLAYVCGDKHGKVYGTTLYSPTIAVWKAGTTNSTPTSTLIDKQLANVGSPSLADGPVACATDSAGDLFVSGQFAVGYTGNWQYYAELDEFVHGLNGSGKAKVLQRETSDLYFPAGVAIDKQRNLAWALFNLSDSGSSVCTYAAPYTGSPTSCTSGFATGFHLTKKGEDLWGGDATVYPWYQQPQAHMANEIAYPGGGLVQSTSGDGLITPVDASVNPPLR
jgi:hypothetical protein